MSHPPLGWTKWKCQHFWNILAWALNWKTNIASSCPSQCEWRERNWSEEFGGLGLSHCSLCWGKSTGQQKTSVSVEWDLLLSSFLTLLLSLVSYLSCSVLKSWFTGWGLITSSRIRWDISERNVAPDEGAGVSASVTVWVQPVWWELEERWEGVCHKELESAASVIAGATPAVSMLPVIGFPPPHPLHRLLQETCGWYLATQRHLGGLRIQENCIKLWIWRHLLRKVPEAMCEPELRGERVGCQQPWSLQTEWSTTHNPLSKTLLIWFQQGFDFQFNGLKTHSDWLWR